MVSESGFRQTADVNLYHLTKSFPFLDVYRVQKKSSFKSGSSIRIIFASFHLPLSSFEKL